MSKSRKARSGVEPPAPEIDDDDEIDPRYAEGCSPERLARRQSRMIGAELELRRMLADLRNSFSWVNPLISAAQFRIDARRFIAVDLSVMTKEQLRKTIAAHGGRPAYLEELLAFILLHHLEGASIPTPLVARASFANDDRTASPIYDENRRLSLISVSTDEEWPKNCKFLYVPA